MTFRANKRYKLKHCQAPKQVIQRFRILGFIRYSIRNMLSIRNINLLGISKLRVQLVQIFNYINGKVLGRIRENILRIYFQLGVVFQGRRTIRVSWQRVGDFILMIVILIFHFNKNSLHSILKFRIPIIQSEVSNKWYQNLISNLWCRHGKWVGSWDKWGQLAQNKKKWPSSILQRAIDFQGQALGLGIGPTSQPNPLLFT